MSISCKINEYNLTDKEGFVIKDGGYGTFIEYINALGKNHIIHPKIHDKTELLRFMYILSGARIIGTHTFSANPDKLRKMYKTYEDETIKEKGREEEKGIIERKIYEINKKEIEGVNKSIEEARRIGFDNIDRDLPERFLKFISIGPSGDCYRTEELYDKKSNKAAEYHDAQIRAIIDDDGLFPEGFFLLPETNPDVGEIIGFVKQVRKYDKNIDIVPSFYLNHDKGLLSGSGLSISDAIKKVQDSTGEDLEFMTNCADINTIRRGIENDDGSELGKIIGIYPNPHKETDHLKNNSNKMETYDRTQLIELSEELRGLKENYLENLLIVSICCGATPDDIAMLNTILNNN